MILNLNRYTDKTYVNLLRQVCMCRIPEVRPIAFKVGATSNVAEIGDSVEEDMSEFISNVSSAVFRFVKEDDLCVTRCDCDGVLKLSNLTSGNVSLVQGDKEILHSLARINVQVIFRKAAGRYKLAENREFVRQRATSIGITDVNEWVFINSRHCPVISFCDNLLGELKDGCQHEVEVITNNSIDAETLLGMAITLIKDDIKSF